MREYRVKRKNHTVYDEIDEVPPNISIKKDWRNASVHDWVLADDGGVLQVLRKGLMQKAKGKKRAIHYIGTCTGTYPCTKSAVLDTSRRKNIKKKIENNEKTIVKTPI